MNMGLWRAMVAREPSAVVRLMLEMAGWTMNFSSCSRALFPSSHKVPVMFYNKKYECYFFLKGFKRRLSSWQDELDTVANVGVIFGNFVQADVSFLPFGDVRLRRPRRQSYDQRFRKLDGMSANAVILWVELGQNVLLHPRDQMPACLLHLWYGFGLNQPLSEDGRHQIIYRTSSEVGQSENKAAPTCSVTLYICVRVRMAFFTTFTLSSFSNMLRLAISWSRSSLSRLLNKTETRWWHKRLPHRGETFRRLLNSPRLLDEPDDKLSDFDGLVCLKRNHLLQDKQNQEEKQKIWFNGFKTWE